MEIINILNINFNNVTLKQAVEFAISKKKNNEKIMVVTPNSEIAYMCYNDEKLLKNINNANLILPDGIGIVYASKILKTPIKEKVAGIEFAENIVKEIAKNKGSLYILGGKPNIAKKACENLAKKYDGLKIAGFNDGYYEDEYEVIEDINKRKPDVLFICLGAPKQEIFMNEHFEKINTNIMCGVGGSADIFAGEAKRAPDIFIKLGLEWLYRLLKQPSRIGRMMRLPKFLLLVIKERVKGK